MRRSSLVLVLALAFLLGLPLSAPLAEVDVTVLHDFTGPDGSYIQSQALVTDGSKLYGVAYRGGTWDFGTIYSINLDGSDITVLHEFEGRLNGGWPTGKLAISGSVLYGVTSALTYVWPYTYQGTIYSINTDGSGFTVLHNFDGSFPGGANPGWGLTVSGSVLYGTTHDGGEHGCGLVFSINTDGTEFTVLRSFEGMPGDGGYPWGELTLSGCVLYGTTSGGGYQNSGTVYRINKDGTAYAVLHDFNRWLGGAATDGAHPLSGLAISGSVLYGTAWRGGAATDFTLGGTIFSLNTDGTDFTVLHNFLGGPGDGRNPAGGLAISGSVLYGAAFGGGALDLGTVYAINTDGSGFTALHEFQGSTSDGANPYYSTPLIYGSFLYGTTYVGGARGRGVVYQCEIGPMDLCPGDPLKTEPGICGCGTPETDTDCDGTFDCLDGCPLDPNKIAPGACGCGNPDVDTDTDGDGTADCLDNCPLDPGKTEPGACGCGAPDTDTDGDGTADCLDNCPGDPGKTEPGVCGCGTPDADSDGDGTLDCLDNCPDDPNKTEPGINGCGVEEPLWTFEDGGTGGWYQDVRPLGLILNVVDPTEGDHVIELRAKTTTTHTRFCLAGPDRAPLGLTDTVVQWRMKASGFFYFYVEVDTAWGTRFLYYTPVGEEMLLQGDQIHHSLGCDFRYDQWSTFNRDLAADLADAEPGNTIITVDRFMFRGTTIWVDDISLLPAVPVTFDSSNDGLTDLDERNIYNTDPYCADSDGDGLNDGLEADFWGDDWDADPDGDGVINLLDANSDNDGFDDGREVAAGSDPGNWMSIPPVFYDWEDGSTAGWSVVSGNGYIRIVEDNGGRAIELRGTTGATFNLKHTDGMTWRDNLHNTLTWDMKASAMFYLLVDLETANGHRYIQYTPMDGNKGRAGDYLRLGLGVAAKDGTWHSYSRDLAADVSAVEPGNTILEVNQILYRGPGFFDNVQLQ